MTQVLTERLTKRAQQLNDAQAEKALAFIEFLLAQAGMEKERLVRQDARTILEMLNRVYSNHEDSEENATYKLALRAMTRKGLPKW